MAEYIKLESEDNLGVVSLSTEVLKHIAQIEIEEDKDVSLSQEGFFKSAIQCLIEENKLKLSVNVDVRFKTNVKVVTQRIQARIDETISHMTSYDLDEININVVGFIID